MKLSPTVTIGILILFYAVGVIGMFTAYRSFFLALTPFHLVLSGSLFFVAQSKWNLRFVIDVLLIALASYGIEWIGVHTGYLFGDYHYGPNLGYRLDGIPVLITLNWVLLTFGAASLTKALQITGVLAVVVAAVLMTGLDWLMEPVAMKSGFWNWNSCHVPVYNYVCWFGFSLLFQLWISKRKTAAVNKVWTTLFILMILFFAILN